MRRFITGPVKRHRGEPVSQSFNYSRSRPALTPPPALNPGEAGTHTGHTRRRDTGHMHMGAHGRHIQNRYPSGRNAPPSARATVRLSLLVGAWVSASTLERLGRQPK